MRNKKGNAIIDGLTILVVLFAFALISVFGMKVFDDVNTDIQADTDMNLTEAKAVSQDLYDKYPALLDNLLLFAFGLLVIFTLVSVFMLDTHPIFFIITIMLLVGVFIVAIIFANTYDDLMTDTEFSPYANQFPYTSWLMTHLVEVMIAVCFLLSIGLFVKFRMA